MTTPSDIERIKRCLAFIEANPTARAPIGWIDEVKAEARAAGLLPPLKPRIGCNCREGIDRGIVYGGDYPDVF